MNRVDPVLYLLLAGMLIFTAVMLFVDFKRSTDSEVFQVVAGVVTGFAGAFFTRLKPSDHPEPPPPGTKTVTATETVQEPPKE